MNLRRLSSTLALLGALASSTAAVAQTVDVQQYWTSASESKAMNAIADAYKARGGKWIDSPSADFDSAIAAATSRIAGGEPPSAVLMTPSGAMRDLAKAGQLRDFNDLAEAGGWQKVMAPLIWNKLNVDGKLVDNPNTKWSQVDPKLPDWDIAAYIPGEKHGTREVFEEKVLADGCKDSGALDALKKTGLDDKAAATACIAVRKDGKAIDIDGDYPETLARIAANKTGVGVFGLYFYENNADKLKVATVNGVKPSAETVASGQYPVSRPLFFYVKKAHIGVVPGLKEYVDFFLSDQMIGPDGSLAEYGLVPAPDAEREAQRAAFDAGKTMTAK